MFASKCQIDWATNSVMMILPTCPIGLHCTHYAPQFLPASTSTTKSTLQLTSLPLPLTLKPTHAPSTSNSRTPPLNAKISSTPSALWTWVRQQKPIVLLSRSRKMPTSPRFCQRWVPKRLLKTQGYYEGNVYIWIPKEQPQQTHPPPQVLRPTQATSKGKELMSTTIPSISIGLNPCL